MTIALIAYHGTLPGAPLVGGQDPVSPNALEALWASNSYYLAAQFQDGEVRRLEISLNNPLIVRCNGQSVHHARVVRDTMAERPEHDGVLFLDTIDGMECGDVVAVFGRRTAAGFSVDHAVREAGARVYDDAAEAWASHGGFPDDVDALPQAASWADDPGTGIPTEGTP